MAQHASSRLSKCATNLSIDSALLAEARRFDINLSKAAESGISQAIRNARATRWKEENQAALDSSNAYVEANGLPLAKYRQF